ncbi:HAD family hydrolase [Arthrobacter ruber]|uniref:HAD family hydrolase n=1 Tax=Arthrobacter ruber TaxID=1258893 RepID=UPI000CF47D73
MSIPAGVRGVVFDVGETLVDESRAWTIQAERAGVTPFALMGLLGALIARDEDHRRVWEMLGVERPADPARIEHIDLYPDALDCLRAARHAGLVVGIAGNQPSGVETQLRGLGFDAGFVDSSAAWGAAKPSAALFAQIIQAAQLDPGEIMYVGDRVDNDILPAHQAGMRTAGHCCRCRPAAIPTTCPGGPTPHRCCGSQPAASPDRAHRPVRSGSSLRPLWGLVSVSPRY